METDDVTVTSQDPGADPAGCTPAGPGELSCERTLYSTHHGPVFNNLVGVPLPWTNARRVLDGRRQRGELPLPQPLLRDQPGPERRGARRGPAPKPGHPLGQHDRRRLVGRGVLRRHLGRPRTSPTRRRRPATPRSASPPSRLLRLPVLDGDRGDLRVGRATPTRSRTAPSAPRTCRRSSATTTSPTERQLLAHQPRGAARGLRPDHRRRANAARAAHAQRPRDDRGGARRRRQLHAPGAPGHGVRQPPVRGRAVPRRPRRDVRGAPAASCSTTRRRRSNVSEACPVLADWDLRDDLGSNGAILFRRFVSRAFAFDLGGQANVPVLPAPAVFTNSFSASDPVHTPNGLNTAQPRRRARRSPAPSATSSDCTIPLDAPLRGYQSETRGGDAIPIHGGPGTLGVFNAINVSWRGLRRLQRRRPRLELRDGHRLRRARTASWTARSSPTRSPRTPTRPTTRDQTELFSGKQWVDVPYYESEIAADQISSAVAQRRLRAAERDRAAGCEDGGDDPAPGAPGPGLGRRTARSREPRGATSSRARRSPT